MTLPQAQVGDRDQRYEVRFTTKGDAAEHVLGWHDEPEGAQRMADGWTKRPSTGRAWVVDRAADRLPPTES